VSYSALYRSYAHSASRFVYWPMNIKRFREARAKKSNQTAGVMLISDNQALTARVMAPRLITDNHK
jgi:hypothetical protein